LELHELSILENKIRNPSGETLYWVESVCGVTSVTDSFQRDGRRRSPWYVRVEHHAAPSLDR
jgi:hypothetical protein